MAANTAGQEPSQTTIDIKVLSQLPGTDSSIILSTIPRSFTVKDLKTRLQTELQCGPALEHQRLIYQGRVLARETDTVQDVFGKDKFDKGGMQILHLVVRSQASLPPQPRASSTNQSDASQATQPSNESQPPPPQQPAVQLPQHPALGPDANGHPRFQIPMMPGQPQMQFINGNFQPQMFQQHTNQVPVQPQTPFNAQNRANAGQGIPQHPPGNPLLNHPHLAHHHQMHNMILQNLGQQAGGLPMNQAFLHGGVQLPFGNQQAIAQNLSAPRPQPVSTATLNVAGNEDQAGRSTPQGQPQPGTDGLAPQPAHNTVTINPNAQRPIMPPGAVPIFSQAMPGQVIGFHTALSPNAGGMNANASSAPQRGPMHDWPGMPPIGLGNQYYGAEHAIASMRHWHGVLQEFSQVLRRQVDNLQQANLPVANSVFMQVQAVVRLRNRAQSAINDLLLPGNYQNHMGLGAEQVAVFQQLTTTFSAEHDEVQGYITRLRMGPSDTHEAPRNPSTSVETSSSTETTRSAQPVTAYLLSSPTGPHAVLFSPQGAFTGIAETQSTLPDLARTNERLGNVLAQVRQNTSRSPSMMRRNRQLEERITRARDAVAGLNREIGNANDALNQANAAVTGMHNANMAANGVAAQGHANRAALAQAQEQGQNDANDVVNIMATVFRQLWLMIRIFGFIWLVTRNGSTRRTIFMVIASLIYLAAQAGFLGNTFERLRRHFENLLGIPQEEPREGARAADQQPRPGGGQDAAAEAPDRPRDGQPPNQPSRGPDPREAAERLLRERREQDRGWLMAQVVRLERALALFVASLYPGVGERHVQAHERAIREAREAEERATRERNEAQANASQVDAREGQSPAATEGDGSEADAELVGISATGNTVEQGEGSSSAVATRDEEGDGELRGRASARTTET